MSHLFVVFLFFFIKSLAFAQPIIEQVYERAIDAQNNGKYAEFVESIGERELKLLEKELVELLEEAKSVQISSSKEWDVQKLVDYESSAHQQTKKRSLNLLSHTNYSLRDIVGGQYVSKDLAESLIKSIRSYEESVVMPLLFQVESQLRAFRPKMNIFSIGRDFTRGHIYFSSRKNLNSDLLYNANFSRKVRDDVFESKDHLKVVRFLAKQGLTADNIIQNGVVFIDSSMSGKIPRSIIYSLAQELSPGKRYEFLRRCEFIYLNSSRRVDIHSGETRSEYSFPEYIEVLSQGNRSIDDAQLSKSVEYFSSIVPRFELSLPKSHRSWPERHQHNLLEHTYKGLLTSERLERVDNGGALVIPKLGSNIFERIQSILGFLSESYLFHNANNYELPLEVDIFKDGIVWREAAALMDRLAQKGFQSLAEWQYSILPGAQNSWETGEIKKSSSSHNLFEFDVRGHTLFYLGQKIGEGRSVEAYQLTNQLAFKRVKEARHVRKNFMLSWMQPHMQKYGLKFAEVRYLEPFGTWLIQDMPNSKSLEQQYLKELIENGLDAIPSELKVQVLEEWEKALKLAQEKDVWLDFKAANYALSSKGDIVNIDYVPRLNKGHKGYFYDPDTGDRFTNEQILDRFFLHDIRKGKTRYLETKDVKGSTGGGYLQNLKSFELLMIPKKSIFPYGASCKELFM